MLRAEGIVKTYRGPSAPIPVLAGVDFGVNAGEFTVIAGPSGSGKSTLLNVLGLLEDADGGTIWFGDVAVTALSRSDKGRQRGRCVGFVFQAFLLLPSLTALDNVLLAGRYVGAVRGDEGRRRASTLLEQFGMGERGAHYPRELSGGEQQRVAFCRAIFNDPPLILADEPTGNLDDDNGALILKALRARAQAGGAVVVVTHRTDVMAGADAVYALENGRLRRW